MRFFRGLKHFFIPHHGNAYRPRALNKGPLLILLGTVLVTEALFIGILAARESGNTFLAAVLASEIVTLTNSKRGEAGQSGLQHNALLTVSAQAKAEDMAKKGYFSHTSPGGEEPWSWIAAAGYDYAYAGENLAVRFVDSRDVVEAWMASPTHRDNIVKPEYQEIGVGVAHGMYKGRQAAFVVQHFGTPPGRVLAAAAGPAASFNDSLARVLGKLASDPASSTALIFSAIAAILGLILAFSFFHHLQIQHHGGLASGFVVAAVAVALLLMNAQGVFPAEVGSEAAAVIKSEL